MNIFSGLISSQMKTLYSNAISALLYDDACTLPCTINYGITKYDDCVNCVPSVIGGKPSARYQSGGPVAFPMGSRCPVCGGEGKVGTETTENINLMVIWDYREFINAGTIDYSNGMIQTITFASNTPKLKRAQKLTVATDIPNYGSHVFKRNSEPEPCGLGNSDFVACLWEKL